MPAATLAFGRLFDAQPFVCLALDRQGRVLAVTDVLLRLTGATRGAVVGQPLTPTGLGPFGAAWREALPEALLPGAQASTLQPIFFPSPSESAPAALLPWWVPQLTPVPAESGPGVEYVLCSAQQTLAPAASSPLVSPLAPRLAELQFILDQVPAHLAALLEPSHVPAYVSPGMRLLLDDRPMLGKPLADTMPELVDPGLLHLFDEVYRTGEALVLTDFPVSGIDVPTLRGSRRYFDLTYQPLRGADQQVMGVLLFALETTGRVRSRQRLAHLTEEVQRREAQFQELTEALPHITSSADGAGRNTYTSPQWFAYTGQDPAAESRPPWDEAIHPDDLPLVVAQYGAAVSAGQPWELEFRLRRHDGHYRWHHTRTRPSFDAKGRLDGWHGTTVDIHDRRLAEDALRSSQAQLAHKDQELDQILSQLPLGVCKLTGPQHQYSFMNEAYAQLVSHRVQLGQTVAEALPEAVDLGLVALLDQVYATGQPYVGTEQELSLLNPATQAYEPRYYDFIYQALRRPDQLPQGILVTAQDVTERVRRKNN
jgi:PAS domain S-box-containing protein